MEKMVFDALKSAAAEVRDGRNGVLLMVETIDRRKAKRLASEFAFRSYQANGVLTFVFGDEDLKTQLMHDLILQVRSSLMVLLVVVTDPGRVSNVDPAVVREGMFDFKITV